MQFSLQLVRQHWKKKSIASCRRHVTLCSVRLQLAIVSKMSLRSSQKIEPSSLASVTRSKCEIKLFIWGGRGDDTLCIPSLLRSIFAFNQPLFQDVFLMAPLQHPYSNIFHCYPHPTPSPPPQIKILIAHQVSLQIVLQWSCKTSCR